MVLVSFIPNIGSRLVLVLVYRVRRLMARARLRVVLRVRLFRLSKWLPAVWWWFGSLASGVGFSVSGACSLAWRIVLVDPVGIRPKWGMFSP